MNICILGGGVGGLSTAIALKQAGFDVEVYERHAAPTEIGAGIVVWPNAAFVLDELGVLDKLDSVSGHPNYMRRFSNDGEVLGSLDINKLNELMGYSSYSIIRKDLMVILSNRLTELNIKVNYQHKVTSILEVDVELDGKNNRTQIKFENGKVIQPHIVIGADGRMNSIARQYVNGGNKPVYQGFVNWIGVFESSEESFADISVHDYWGVGERFGIVPISNNTAYWAGGAVTENSGVRNSRLYKKELLSIFNTWPDPIKKIIEATPESRINKVYVHDHNPINTWHKSNVLLVGDAAHSPLPTSGQGACQAIEDAWHITRCLKEVSGDFSRAFSLFSEIRMGKTTGITMGGRQLASLIFNNDDEFCKQRNLTAQKTDYDTVIAGMAKGWANGLPIGT